MIRTIITPNRQKLSFQVPANYVGKRIEVIVFPIDEVTEVDDLKEKVQTHLASQSILSRDWLTSEEDIAWKDL